MKSPMMVVPGAGQAIMALGDVANHDSVPRRTLDLVRLRASQINGCSVCTAMHARDLKKAGETDERLWSLASWRDTTYFNDAERAALALTEAATRLGDRADPVSDDVWAEAARHYNEPELGLLVLNIAMINFFNRLSVPTRQQVGHAERARA